MFKVERTQNRTHPITLTTESQYVTERQFVLTEAEASALLRRLICVVNEMEPADLTIGQTLAVREIVRDEVRDMLRKGFPIA